MKNGIWANTRFAPTKRFRQKVGVNLVLTPYFVIAATNGQQGICT